jgi:isoprene-epoxide---glutathione S-transferase
MTVTVYGYLPAWGLPDISPYVTKLIFYMKIRGIEFEYKSQDLSKIDEDAPWKKLPYIIDDGKKVADSNTIIAYFDKKLGSSLDDDLAPTEKAVALAFDRLLAEHLYYSGVLEPRWRMDEGWEVYIPYIVGGAEVGPELRAVLDAFRVRILSRYEGHGMGLRDGPTVLDFYKIDIDAIADFMGDKKYFLGDKLHNVDACAYALLRHLVDQPQKWPGTGYVESKPNLVAYLDRMRKEFNM